MKIRATLEIPDRSIGRIKLEYPTENVSFTYLSIINKVRVVSHQRAWGGAVLTYDVFADKAVIALIQPNNNMVLKARVNTAVDYYRQVTYLDRASEDHKIEKGVAGTMAGLASEAVDLDSRGQLFALSCSGSTVKGLRWLIDGSPVDPLNPGTPTRVISATDTSFASGYFGPRTMREASPHGFADPLSAFLIPPMTPLPPALAVLEVEVKGSGKPGDPYRPLTLEDHIEVTETLEIPDYIKHEAKKYDTLKSKGYTDDEIKLLLGYIPQHQVDRATVTWGAFEFSPNSPTNVIIITGDNPYLEGAIQRQAELARSKNLKTLRPPRNYGEAVAQYNQVRRDYPHWLAGKDNYVYQVLGLEELDLFQNVDFYHGELVEHKTYYQQLRQVQDFEMWRRLEELERRLKKIKVLTDERDKHIAKLKEVKRLGW
jgi:hypothetical protein